MMTFRNKLAVGVAALAMASLPGTTVQASSHREAPGTTKTPKVDNTDVYVFRSYEPGREDFVTIIANYQPIQYPGGGPNYFTMDPDALYEIHVDNDGDAQEDLTFSFQFDNNLTDGGISLNIGGEDVAIPLRAIGPIDDPNDDNLNEMESYQVTLIRGDRRSGDRTTVTNTNGGSSFIKPIDNIGNKTIPDYDAYASNLVYTASVPGCEAGSRVFVGQREEAFAINLGEVFDLVNFVPIEGDSARVRRRWRRFPGRHHARPGE